MSDWAFDPKGPLGLLSEVLSCCDVQAGTVLADAAPAATVANPTAPSDRAPMLPTRRRAMLLVNIDPPECVTHSGGFPGSSNDTTGGSARGQAGLRPCAPGK